MLLFEIWPAIASSKPAQKWLKKKSPVDRQERLVGIVTIDDVFDILEQEATEDIQKLAGVSGGDEGVVSGRPSDGD